MANAQKYTRAACGHLAAHYERRKDEKGEYVKFGNQDIDPQKTHRSLRSIKKPALPSVKLTRRADSRIMALVVGTPIPDHEYMRVKLTYSP